MRYKSFGLYLGLFAGGLTMVFQNCSPPTPEEDSTEAYASSLPFAFEAKLDHVAYMSCSGVPEDAFNLSGFTLRGTAVELGGVKITDSFRLATADSIDRKRLEFLTAGTQNKDIIPVMALRGSRNIASVYKRESGSGSTTWQDGVNVSRLIGEGLNTSQIARPLLDLSRYEWLTTFNRTGVDPLDYYSNRLFGDIRYSLTEEDATQLRGMLNGGSISLALTFGSMSDNLPTFARSPEVARGQVQSVAYGHKYDLRFQYSPKALVVNGSTVTFPDFEEAPQTFRRVANSAFATNLEINQRDPEYWDCPQSLHFMIVRSDAEGEALCPEETLAERNNTSYNDERRAVAAVIPGDGGWVINYRRRCMRQVMNYACYDPRLSQLKVAYDGKKSKVGIRYDPQPQPPPPAPPVQPLLVTEDRPCSINELSIHNDPLFRPRLCPHYMSICKAN